MSISLLSDGEYNLFVTFPVQVPYVIVYLDSLVVVKPIVVNEEEQSLETWSV